MDDNAVRRIKPHNDEAEKSVIGAMLMDREVIADVADMLIKDDFYNPRYGIMFEAMVELYREGKPVDIVELNNKLKMKNVPDEISSPQAIASVVNSVTTSIRIKDHAQIVLDKSLSRSLINLTDNVNKDCYLDQDKIDNILEAAEGKIFKLSQQRNGSKDFVPISDITVTVLEQIQEAFNTKGRITGLETGFTDLDFKLTGLRGGQLVLVAARPAMGKTAFVLNIAHNLAVKHDKPVALFSLEMSKEELVSRMLAIDAMVDSKNLKLGNLTDEDWGKVIESTELLSESHLFIDDNSGITINELRSKCRKLKQQHDIQLIVLDYIQLMSPARAVESRQQFVADVSRALKNLARELDVPIIALSQLSRAVDNRQGNKPVLSDLRESGAIEQDADIVMFIYRDEYYNPDTTAKPNTAEIIIAKNRGGEVGNVDLRWIGKYTKFANPERPANS